MLTWWMSYGRLGRCAAIADDEDDDVVESWKGWEE